MRTSNKAFLTPAEFAAWQDRHGWTGRETAAVLGLSPRMIDGLRSGEKPVTRLIANAMAGVDVLVKPGRAA